MSYFYAVNIERTYCITNPIKLILQYALYYFENNKGLNYGITLVTTRMPANQ